MIDPKHPPMKVEVVGWLGVGRRVLPFFEAESWHLLQARRMRLKKNLHRMHLHLTQATLNHEWGRHDECRDFFPLDEPNQPHRQN